MDDKIKVVYKGLNKMNNSDLKILSDRKNTLISKITWHKEKLAKLESELENINNFLEK